jgi:hypothetical protein
LRNSPPAQQAVHGAGVVNELRPTDVFVYADARDLVERPVADLTVVGHPDLQHAPETGGANAVAGELGLGLGQRDAHASRVVVAAACISIEPQPDPMSSGRLPETA